MTTLNGNGRTVTINIGLKWAIAIVLATWSPLVLGSMWVARIEFRVSAIEQELDNRQPLIERLTNVIRDQANTDARLKRIEDKLDNLLERSGPR